MALSKILPASQEQYAGARNLIINGAMQVAQRGTSFTATAYSLDHWYISEGGTCTVTQDTADVPSNFKYAMKTTTSAASSFVGIYQPFESVDYEAFKNKTVTISFYAKVNSTFSGTMFVDMQTGDTADTLLSGTWANSDPQYFTPTTSWARYTASIAIGSTNGIRLQISPSSAQASGEEYSITGVQLEVGEPGTPIEHRSFGDELARCQRYYQSIDTNGRTQTIGFGHRQATNTVRFSIPSPVALRADPSISISGTVNCLESDGSSTATTSISGLYNSNGYVVATGTASGVVAGSITMQGYGGTVQIDAEL